MSQQTETQLSLQPIISFDNDLLQYVTSEFKALNDHVYDLDEIIRYILDFLAGCDVLTEDISYNTFISSKYGECIFGGVRIPGTSNTEDQIQVFERAVIYLYTHMTHTFKGYYIGTRNQATGKTEPFKHVYFTIDPNLRLLTHTAAVLS